MKPPGFVSFSTASPEVQASDAKVSVDLGDKTWHKRLPEANHHAAFLLCLHAFERAHRGQSSRLYGVPGWVRWLPISQQCMLERLMLGYAPTNPFRGIVLGRAEEEIEAAPSHPSLLVGEKPSAKWGRLRPNWPFISTLATGCSGWLANQLTAAGVKEVNLCWLNLYTISGELRTDLPLDLLRRYPWRRVVALGKLAFDGCTAIELPVTDRVHHPAYWMKYQGGKKYKLLNILRGEK